MGMCVMGCEHARARVCVLLRYVCVFTCCRVFEQKVLMYFKCIFI